MTDRLSHRGPDGRGVWHSGPVGLGHRRLAVVGLATGQQPMSDRSGRVHVTYNGEIYNYRTLRKQLEADGYVFETASDTEVLVHGYQAWGRGMVHRLRGMFAFALYDAKQRWVFAARDRVGIKPFYYFLSPDLFAFASEPKGLLLHPDVPRRPNLDAVHLAALYGYVPPPYCAFEGLMQLAPGAMLTVGHERARVDSYWTCPELGSGTHSFDMAAFEAKLDDAVSSELMSEVPLGTFLSGGIDSSVVTASASRQVNGLRTFSMGFAEPRYDESAFAQEVASVFHTNHHREIMDIEGLDLLEALVDIYDEPFGDSSAMPTYALSRMTRKFVTVALSGDGGDEVFGGYRRYQKLHGFHALPRPIRWAANAMQAVMPSGVRGQQRLQRSSMDLGAQYDFENRMLSPRDEQAVLTEDLRSRGMGGWLTELFRNAPGEGVQRAQWVDFVSYLPGDILTKVDRASMAHGLEVRVPLLDHEFIEAVAGYPPELLFGGGEGKVALKRYLRMKLPGPLVNRPKMGFGVPLELWLGGQGGLRARFDRLRDHHPRRGFFAPIHGPAVDALLNRVPVPTSALWNLLFLESWWQKNFC
jgi:asparagine synthase (glutamine-hydrolysing)